MYCPHRFGLIKIDDVWAENIYVIKANLLHKNVHSNRVTYKKGVKVLNSVSVYNDEYDLFGVVDAIELTKSKEGVIIEGETYELTIVEHKPTKPKQAEFNLDDAVQVFAQKICIDYIFKTDSKAVIYYSDVKKRVSLPFDTEYAEYSKTLRQLLAEMKECIRTNTIPKVKKGQKCSGCSLKDLCIPKLKNMRGNKQSILSLIEGEL